MDDTRELEYNLKHNVKYKPIKSPLEKPLKKLIIFIISIVKKLRGREKIYFWTDKENNKLTFKQFLKRWRAGIEGITPLQQAKGQLNSTYIMLVGIAAGFVVSLFSIKNLWWLTIILGGAFFNTLISALGIWQKKRLFENMDYNFNTEKEVKINE